LGKRSFAISAITAGLHAAHLSDEGLELGGAAEVLPGEGKLVLLGGDIHGQFHMSVGIGQECPVSVVALDPVTRISLRTHALTVLRKLVDLPLIDTPPWTGPWDVATVTLAAGAVFLILLILAAASILRIWSSDPIRIALESPLCTNGAVIAL